MAYSLELPTITLPVHSKFQQAWWITSCLWERALVEGRHKKSTLLFPLSERFLARQGSTLGAPKGSEHSVLWCSVWSPPMCSLLFSRQTPCLYFIPRKRWWYSLTSVLQCDFQASYDLFWSLLRLTRIGLKGK